MRQAHDFVLKIKEAEQSLIREKIKLIVNGEDTFDEPMPKWNAGQKGKEVISAFGSSQDEDEEVYSSLQEKWEADKKARDKEGKGVRLQFSHISDGTESAMKSNFSMKGKSEITKCSDYEAKM